MKKHKAPAKLAVASPVDAAEAADRAKVRAIIRAAVDRFRSRQELVAELAGVHPVTLSRWLHDNGSPLPYQRAIFEALGTTEASAYDVAKIKSRCGVVPALLHALRHKMPTVQSVKRKGRDSWQGPILRVTVSGQSFDL